MVDLFIDMVLQAKENFDKEMKQVKILEKKLAFREESKKFQRLADYLKLHKFEIEDYIEDRS